MNIEIQPEPLILSYTLDEFNRPCVALDETLITSTGELAAKLPALLDPLRLNEYCRTVNFLTSGYRYHVIEDPDTFRQNYDARYLECTEQDTSEDGVVRLSDFGLFDTSEIRTPRVDGDHVVFFVEDDIYGVPSRVTAPMAASTTEGNGELEVKYEALRLAQL